MAAPFDLIIITGPPAAGKMTVGRALSEQTGYKLLHNHVSLELANQFFDWSTPPFKRIDRMVRFGIFREVAASPQQGFIFTFVWAFGLPEEEAYVREIIDVFAERDLRVRIVNLACSQEERLVRNRHPDRLDAKPSKRDVEASEQRLFKEDATYRMVVEDGDLPEYDVFRIDNTALTAEETARCIREHFGL